MKQHFRFISYWFGQSPLYSVSLDPSSPEPLTLIPSIDLGALPQLSGDPSCQSTLSGSSSYCLTWSCFSWPDCTQWASDYLDLRQAACLYPERLLAVLRQAVTAFCWEFWFFSDCTFGKKREGCWDHAVHEDPLKILKSNPIRESNFRPDCSVSRSPGPLGLWYAVSRVTSCESAPILAALSAAGRLAAEPRRLAICWVIAAQSSFSWVFVLLAQRISETACSLAGCWIGKPPGVHIFGLALCKFFQPHCRGVPYTFCICFSCWFDYDSCKNCSRLQAKAFGSSPSFRPCIRMFLASRSWRECALYLCVSRSRIFTVYAIPSLNWRHQTTSHYLIA